MAGRSRIWQGRETDTVGRTSGSQVNSRTNQGCTDLSATLWGSLALVGRRPAGGGRHHREFRLARPTRVGGKDKWGPLQKRSSWCGGATDHSCPVGVGLGRGSCSSAAVGYLGRHVRKKIWCLNCVDLNGSDNTGDRCVSGQLRWERRRP